MSLEMLYTSQVFQFAHRSKMLIFIILFSLCATAVSENYCLINSAHTMCRFSSGPGRACGKRSCGGLTSDEIETILRVHNELRASVANGHEKHGAPGPQPPAADMRSLVWDNRLAEVAQRWADQCTFQHDKCRDDPRFPVGQNMYWSSGTAGDADWSRIVRLWFGEVKDVNSDLVRTYAYDQSTAHYSQLVWAQTRFVGCGRRSYGGSFRPRGSIALEHLLGEARNGTGYEDEEKVDETVEAESQKGGAEETGKRKPRLSDSLIESFLNSKSRHTLMPKLAEKIRSPDWSYPSSSKYLPIYAYAKYTRPFSSDLFSDYESSENSVEPSSSESLEGSSGEEADEDDKKPEAIVVSPDTIELTTWTSQGWQVKNYDWSDDQILVCNYGPTGNVLGQPVYEIGMPCSRCPEGTACRNGLCV